MGYVTTKDGVELFYKDWGPRDAQVIYFHHGWPLSSDDWDAQMLFFLAEGFRVVAHDRRGHGRSSQVWDGHDMDHYADDPVPKAAIISAVPPLMVKTEGNPGGLPKSVFDDLQAQLAANRAQFYQDIPAGPFYGYNRPGAQPSEGIVRNWWRQGMMGGAKAHYDGIVAFSQTDFSDDLKRIDIPVLVMHGDDDQIVPYENSGVLSAKLLRNGTLKTYPGFPHGMPTTQAEVINADLLAFIRG
ncbi:TPA: alpha/beta hydrolase [Pseudomonas aeruginosa]|nr:alpha/beta hydrolase [Pseudomonas aeruginosa]